MAARPVHREAQFVACGHVFAGAESERPDFELRLDVFADHGPDVVAFERIFGQHQRRTARIALLARLEQPEYRAAEIRLGGQLLQHAEQHRGVHVVAAGVHDPLVAGAPVCVVPLVDRQGVDVGAQYHGPAFGVGFAAAFDLSQHARSGYGTVLDAQLREPGGDKGRRVVLPERQFGVHVQVTAELDGIHFS